MKHAPEYQLEVITDGKRTVYSFVGHDRAVDCLNAAAREPTVISVELHVIIPTVLPRRPTDKEA